MRPMKLHRLPNSGLILELRDDVELTEEQKAALDAYLPVFIDHERGRLAAMTPCERRSEQQGWAAVTEQPVRGHG